MFRATPNIQIASMIRENEGFVRGLLPIPRVAQLYSTLLYSTLLYSSQLKLLPGLKDLLRQVPTRYSALFNTFPFNSTLPNSTQLYPALLNTCLLNSTLPNSTQLYPALLNSTLLNSTQLYSALLNSTCYLDLRIS